MKIKAALNMLFRKPKESKQQRRKTRSSYLFPKYVSKKVPVVLSDILFDIQLHAVHQNEQWSGLIDYSVTL